MKDTAESTLQTVMKIFVDYLVKNGYRKTPERFTILTEIYATEGHFDIETLYNQMKAHKYRVSRATLYNTIELLLDCKLVTKHQFANNSTQYERSYRFKEHDHFIDVETGTVLEFSDSRLDEIQAAVEKALNVEISHHALIFYGKIKNTKNP